MDCAVNKFRMPKKLKRYLANSALTVIWLALVTGVVEAIGEPFFGKYHIVIIWGLRILSLGVACIIVWRIYIGVSRDGDLLIDD